MSSEISSARNYNYFFYDPLVSEDSSDVENSSEIDPLVQQSVHSDSSLTERVDSVAYTRLIDLGESSDVDELSDAEDSSNSENITDPLLDRSILRSSGRLDNRGVAIFSCPEDALSIEDKTMNYLLNSWSDTPIPNDDTSNIGQEARKEIEEFLIDGELNSLLTSWPGIAPKK